MSLRKIALIFGIVLIAIVISQIVLLWRDRKQNQHKPVKFAFVKLVPFLLFALGYLAYALPWINLPIIGGISFLRVLKSSSQVSLDSDVVLAGLMLNASYWLLASATFFQLVFKVPVKSKLTLLLEVLVGLGSTALGIFMIAAIRSSYSGMEQSFFGDIFQISIGFGLYLATSIGILYAGFVLYQHYNTLKKWRTGTVANLPYDRLRELKKLYDEGVITAVEFEQQKAAFLEVPVTKN